MLVLSRRVGEKIVFPNLGITVHLLEYGGQRIRVGIAGLGKIAEPKPAIERSKPWPPPEKFSEGLRLRLRTAANQLNALDQQLEAGETDDAQANILRVFRELRSMDEEIASHCGGKIRTSGGTAGRTLLVDDNQNETQLLASYLRSRRFEVATASNGASAMHYLSHNKIPDFVLLDMQMPKFDGRWTINEIRRIPRYADLKVFAVSGIDPREYGVEVGPDGIDGWFHKPLNPESLVAEMYNGSDKTRAASTN